MVGPVRGGKTVTIDVRSNKKSKSSERSKTVISKSSSSRSQMAKNKSQSNQLFSGRVLGFEVPGVSGVLRNKTFQKAAAGAGVVSIVLGIAQLVNNASINKQLAKKEVRIGLAALGGDITGAAVQFAKEGGIKSLSTTTTTTTTLQQFQNREGFA